MKVAPRRPLHVTQVGFFSDPQGRTPTQLLQSWSTVADVAEAAGRSGARVSVVQACRHREEFVRNDVHYYFLPHASLTEQLRALAPDVLHVHGLEFTSDVLSLAAHFPDIPIVLQDHASRPPPFWRRPSWRRALAVSAGIAFCALEQARPFARAGLFPAKAHVYEIPESTTRFTPGDREEARRKTGIGGDPAVLWVGHLDANKDPLTVLEGISTAGRLLPGLRLWCCYGAAPLLPQVQNRIASDPHLRHRVQLIGRVPHERIEQLMRAADLFVLGSHREGSGYSLIEALACGLPPIVTDIPSFRSLTAAGTVGSLWPCDDARALAAALQSMAARAGTDMRTAVRTHFDRQLSFEALGMKLAAMYRDVIGHSQQVTAAAPHHPRHGAAGTP